MCKPPAHIPQQICTMYDANALGLNRLFNPDTVQASSISCKVLNTVTLKHIKSTFRRLE